MINLPIYYYSAQWLQGPLTLADFVAKVEQGEIPPETPAWTPSANSWLSADFFLQLSQQTDDATPTLAESTDGDYDHLPAPQTLFAMWKKRRAYPASAVENGGYELLNKLGVGGMGITYRAQQLSLDRPVALKILLPRFNQDEKFIRRFVQEARAIAKLNHEHIAAAYEVGNCGREHFLAMEFVDGVTLAQQLEHHGKFSETAALDIVEKIAQALQYAFALGILHRDISAKNIMITRDGKPKLIDLGLSKDLHAPREPSATGSDSHTPCGTPAYMSPERALGRRQVDIRSDLYSLGCVLYEMLCGTPPFKGESALATISLHLHNDVPEIPHVSAGMQTLVHKLTRRELKERYQNPTALLRAIAELKSTLTLPAPTVEKTMAEILPISEQLNQWTDTAVALTLHSDWREYLHVIALTIEKKLTATNAPPDFQGYVQTIFAELTANAFDHGVVDQDEGRVELRIELNDIFFRLEVEDSGDGFAARATIKELQSASLRRERQRGLLQVSHLADLLEFNKKGNRVKAVIYRKSVDSGVEEEEREGILFVEVNGKGDMALAEDFRRWVDNYPEADPTPLCLQIRTDWVSSMFVGSLAKLSDKTANKPFALWVERSACRRIMQQLGITSFIAVQASLEKALATVKSKMQN